jgi:two-component system phosphate regulon sensor histidine kinase PhoR
LADGAAPADEHDEMHRALAREAKRLGTTVDRLLGFSRMEAGKQKGRLQRACVAEVVDRVVDTFVERHDAEVRRDLDASLFAAIDAEQLGMAVDNILENARKYAPGGTPYEVRVHRDGDELCISVRDRGPGIARRDHARIFRPFERADERLSEATEGSGIGLSLVRHVARLHGGRASVDSAPGKGATFMIWIPTGDTPS